jgi:Flp pilus assembly protein TadG
MSHPGRIVELAGNERGAVLVMFAVFAPVAVLLAAFALDTGNWFLHKRHLQLQADAGALAAAQMFQPCNNTAVKSAVEQYSGVASVSYNAQIGGTSSSNIHELINSKTFYNQPSSPKPDDTVTTEPCSAQMVDVKLTETSLPWYWRLFSSVPYIDAQARVSIRKLSEATGSFPVAVNDLRPKAVEAYFVDESVSPAKQLMTCGSSGTSPCSVALKSGPTSNGLSVWNNIETPFPLAVRKPDVSVRVAISGRSTLTGSMTTDCEQKFVTCSDASSAGVGLMHIQGYTGNGIGTMTVPIARKVQLSGAPAGCTDGYFSNPSASCGLAVGAEVDWGTPTRPTGADVDAVVGGICYALTFKSSSGTKELWSSEATAPAGSCSNFTKAKEKAGTGYVPLAKGAGAIQVDLQAKDSSATKTFSAVQRTYAASSNSEPVQEALLGREGGFSRDEDSFRMCESGNEGAACTPNLIITLGISGSLGDAQATSDPIYTMRFSGTGSQNQSVSCLAVNGGNTFADTLASGCKGRWAINPTLTCPDSANPFDCIAPATGNKENQVAKGMNLRILGSTKPSTCTHPNLWKTFTFTNGVPSVSTTDPRVVTAFVTPYGSFGGNGSTSSFPITEFATFYVTGWQDNGNGFGNPCQGNGDDTAVPGTIVGHFIKYVTLDTSGTGTEQCEPNALGQCVAVLTR